MSSNSDKPVPSPLVDKLKQLKNLNGKDSEKDIAEISNILLWIATYHPEAFQEEAEELLDISVKRLYFRNSWEYVEELVPTDALVTILNSDVCGELKAFCGYVNDRVLDSFNQYAPLCNIRLGLGRHINVRLLIKKLKDRRLKHSDSPYLLEEDITIHLRSRELDLKDLVSLPDIHPKLYISDVKDQDAAWVAKAVAVLQPKPDPRIQDGYPYFEAVYLPKSKLSAAGVEAIAKELLDAGISLETFGVSSCNINEHSKIPGYKNVDNFAQMISEKYNLGEVFFDDDDGLEFTEFTDYIPDDSSDSSMDSD